MKQAADEYSRRLSGREAEAAALAARHERLASLRLALFAIFVAMALAAWQWHLLSGWWLLVPAAAFVLLVAYHSSVGRAWKRVERIANFYRRGTNRMQDRWQGQGPTGSRFADPHHVYAADLDLFGPDSLFQLLSIARTRMGEDKLAEWLLSPATAEEIARRQACVTELRELLDLREELAVMGEDRDVSVQPQALVRWAQAPNALTAAWLPVAAFVLPVLAIAGVWIWNAWGTPSPLVVIVAIEGFVLAHIRKPLDEILFGAEGAFEDLRLLAALPERLEREPFKTPQLQALVKTLLSHDLPASTTIGRLAKIVQWIESRRNPILAVLQIPLMYPVHAALAAQRWRAAHGHAVATWLDAIGTIEALNSIAAYSYEHPADPFPVIVDGPATFSGQFLGHPLIPTANCVRNDARIEGATRVLLISGSNMSGKSTLLRTVGINTILAMAGAPVRASSLKLTVLRVGASIRINDSLHEGSSRFYAEITRLRQLHDISGKASRDISGEKTPHLLFLLDELLQGTNSSDRRIGAEGVIRAFMDEGSIGLISTHDLALTDVDGVSSERVRNHHFQDELIDGRLSFDFTLRDGVVTRSNGIELMRSIGLKV